MTSKIRNRHAAHQVGALLAAIARPRPDPAPDRVPRPGPATTWLVVALAGCHGFLSDHARTIASERPDCRTLGRSGWLVGRYAAAWGWGWRSRHPHTGEVYYIGAGL